MAEPRKPRVIKTRTGGTPAPGTAASGTPASGGTPVGTGDSPAASGNTGPASANIPAPGVPGEGSAVRSTSSKVSVQPLAPTGGESATDADKAAAKAPAGKWPTGRALAGKMFGSKSAEEPEKAAASAAPKVSGTAAPQSTPKTAPKTTPKAGPKAGPQGAGKTSGKTSGKSPNKGPGTAAPEGSGGDAGAQVLAFPLPPHKRRRRNIVYGVAGVVVVLALVMSFALFSPALAVKTVVFEGRKLVAEETLQAALAPVLGTPLPQVSEKEVQDLLKPVIQVKSAIISAQPPSTLVVRVVERVPVALLKNNDDYLLVDQDGVELGATTDPSSVALPLIDGGKAAIGQETFNAVTAVLANLPQGILGRLANASAASPDAVELKLVDGRSVIWGDASDLELKAQVLEALLNAPPPTAAPGKPEPAPVQVFDVSAPRHPVTR